MIPGKVKSFPQWKFYILKCFLFMLNLAIPSFPTLSSFSFLRNSNLGSKTSEIIEEFCEVVFFF